MMKYNNTIARYFKDIINNAEIFSIGDNYKLYDKNLERFYNIMEHCSKAQLVELIYLWFCHIECNELIYEYEDLFNEFIESVLEVE